MQSIYEIVETPNLGVSIYQEYIRFLIIMLIYSVETPG